MYKLFDKSFFAGFASVTLTVVSAYFDKLLWPVVVLIFVMAIDYATGVVKAYLSRTLSSRVGMVGILKKICCLLAVGAGMSADYIIAYSAQDSGFSSPIACLIAIWLIINETISITENLRDIGVPLPKFLTGLIERLQNDRDKKL